MKRDVYKPNTWDKEHPEVGRHVYLALSYADVPAIIRDVEMAGGAISRVDVAVTRRDGQTERLIVPYWQIANEPATKFSIH